jgi:hypothetical protein
MGWGLFFMLKEKGHGMGPTITQYVFINDDVHLSSIIQSIQVIIDEEEPYFERRKT